MGVWCGEGAGGGRSRAGGGRRLASTLLSVRVVASAPAAAEEIIDSGALIPRRSTVGPDPRGRRKKGGVGIVVEGWCLC